MQSKFLKNTTLLFVKDYVLIRNREKNWILCNKRRVYNHTANFKDRGGKQKGREERGWIDCLSSNSSPL